MWKGRFLTIHYPGCSGSNIQCTLSSLVADAFGPEWYTERGQWALCQASWCRVALLLGYSQWRWKPELTLQAHSIVWAPKRILGLKQLKHWEMQPHAATLRCLPPCFIVGKSRNWWHHSKAKRKNVGDLGYCPCNGTLQWPVCWISNAYLTCNKIFPSKRAVPWKWGSVCPFIVAPELSHRMAGIWGACHRHLRKVSVDSVRDALQFTLFKLI